MMATFCEHTATKVPNDAGFPIPACSECGRLRSDLANHMIHFCHDFTRPGLDGLPMWKLEEMHQAHHDAVTYGEGHTRTDWSMQSVPAFKQQDPATVIAELRAIAADTA